MQDQISQDDGGKFVDNQFELHGQRASIKAFGIGEQADADEPVCLRKERGGGGWQQGGRERRKMMAKKRPPTRFPTCTSTWSDAGNSNAANRSFAALPASADVGRKPP